MKNNLSKKALNITRIAVCSALIIFAFSGRYFQSFLKDVANFFLGSFGMAFYGVMVALIVACSFSLSHKRVRIPTKYIVHFSLLFLTVVLFVHTLTTMYLPTEYSEYAHLVYNYYDLVPTMGGVVFGSIAYAIKTVLSTVGAIILYVILLVVNVFVIGDFFYCYATGNLVLKTPSEHHRDDENTQPQQPVSVVQAQPQQQPRTPREKAYSVLFENETDDYERQSGNTMQYPDLPQDSDTPISRQDATNILFGTSVDSARPQPFAPIESSSLFGGDVQPDTRSDDRQAASSFFDVKPQEPANQGRQDVSASDYFSSSSFVQQTPTDNSSWLISNNDHAELSRPQEPVEPKQEFGFSPIGSMQNDGIVEPFVSPTANTQKPKQQEPANTAWQPTPIVDYDGKQEGYIPAKPVVSVDEPVVEEPPVANEATQAAVVEQAPAKPAEPIVSTPAFEQPKVEPIIIPQPVATQPEQVDVTEIVTDEPQSTFRPEPTPTVVEPTVEQNDEPPFAVEEPAPESDDEDEMVVVPTEKIVKGGIQTGFDVVSKKEAEQQPKIHKYLKYNEPPMELLSEPQPYVDLEEEDRQAAADAIIRKLSVFGIEIELDKIIVGPAFSRYMFKVLSLKTRMGDFARYSDDIKACLEAPEDIRIEAPVHGTNLVGIEVANRKKGSVALRAVLESPEFQESKGKLTFAIGQDIMGKPIIRDLAKFPHLLVAGQTGSGKSVALNCLIVSLMYKYGPEYLRFVMVDPKLVELSRYNGIPHMLTAETITKTNDALAAMDYLVNEMENRYKLFQSMRVGDITDYNNRINPQTTQKLPYIVYIVDELADLMMTCKQALEQKIGRLAAKARAAGIHLVLATQRPDVKVITGNIKANLNARIALTVSSQFDSRTIIDCGGAEKLLGRGDMLLMDPSAPDLERIQGAYVGNDEIREIVECLKNQNESFFDPTASEQIFVTEAQEAEAARQAQEEAESAAGKENAPDKLAKKALRFWLERNSGKASISSLTRSLSIGFSRAGRIFDYMQKMHYIEEPPANEPSTKPVKVLVTLDDLDSLFPDLDDEL